MSVTYQMIARRPFLHRGQRVKAGDVLTVSPVEAAAYIYQRIATYHRQSDAPVEPPPQPVTRRRYRRRDLVADSSE